MAGRRSRGRPPLNGRRAAISLSSTATICGCRASSSGSSPSQREHRAPLSYTAFRRIDESGTVTGRLIQVPRSLTYDQLLKNTAIATLTAMVDREIAGPIVMKNEGVRRFLPVALDPESAARPPTASTRIWRATASGAFGIEPPGALRRMGLAHLPQRRTALPDQIGLVLCPLECASLVEAAAILIRRPTGITKIPRKQPHAQYRYWRSLGHSRYQVRRRCHAARPQRGQSGTNHVI